MKKKAAFLLILAIMFSSLGGCVSKTESEETEKTDLFEQTAETTSAESEEENIFIADDLPDDLNFGGETVNTFGWDGLEGLAEFYVEELNGELVNDAIFERNLAVEERLDVNLEYRLEPGAYDQRNTWVQTLSSSIIAGSGAYDISAGYSMAGASLATKGMCFQLNDMPYIDFSKPWWPSSLLKESSCGGGLYFCSGDISLYMIYYLYGIYFNQDMLSEYELENPYDLVQSGTWTIDKMSEMSSGVYVDLNGDGMKGTEDRLGYITYGIFVDPYFFSCGLRTTEKDENDIPFLSAEFNGDKAHSVVEKVVALTTSAGAMIGSDIDLTDNMFQEGRSLLTSHEFTYAISHLREASFTYGIVPFPKYDDAQENYVTITSFPYTLYGIPIDAKSPEMSAAVIEALASEGYRNVSPVLFEEAYKVKYARDEESAVMFDLIRSTVSFDFGRVFNNDLNSLTYSLFRNAIVSQDTNWISTTEKSVKQLTKALNRLTESLLGE